MVKARWKAFRYRLEELGLRAAAAVVPRLPRRWLLGLASFAGAMFHRFDHRSRRVAMENLRLAFPKLSERRRDLIARGSARNLARTFLDLFWARNLTYDNYLDYCTVEGLQAAHQGHYDSGSHVICCAHFGNFEWASILGGFAGFESLIVAQELKNPALDAIINRARTVCDHRVTPRTQAMLKMLRAVKTGEGVGLLVDLSLPPAMPTTALRTFGGLRICASILHAILNERTGVPLTPLAAFPRRDGKYRLVFHEPLYFPPGTIRAEIAQAVWDAHEKWIRRRPSLWLWSYKHFRYQPEHAGREYPWYAMKHADFEKLLQAENG